MNILPNLQIHIHNYTTEDTTNNNRHRRTAATTNRGTTTTNSNLFSNLVQSILRRDVGNTEPIYEDIQILFNTDPLPISQSLRLEDLSRYTSLFVHENADSEECSICRNAFLENEICRKVNQCNHFFHQSCVDQWFSRNSTCPMCRQSVYPNTN
jgi:hypothetical protein